MSPTTSLLLRTLALVLLVAGVAEAKYECSAQNPCGSEFCRSKNVEGWFCNGEKPIRCGDCYWDNKLVKCREIGMKRTCAPGERCVTMLATCVVAAAPATYPSWIALLVSSMAAIFTMAAI